MSELHIPFGLCGVTYDGSTYTNLASEALFETKPTYKIIKAGQLKEYILEDYNVSLTLALTEENYSTLKLSNHTLNEHNGGLYDDPSNVNHVGKLLTIHPMEAGVSKEYDITIFSAILDPEQPFTRKYDHGIDILNVKFLGQPAKEIDDNVFKSYYFIGDAEMAGVI